MDMAFGGRYFSDFLFLSILSLSARHLADHDRNFNGVDKGEQLLSRAKELLFAEMSATKPRIPTIQGLLILGGRQCAMGKNSEGWLYTGMVRRLAISSYCLSALLIVHCTFFRQSTCSSTLVCISTYTSQGSWNSSA